MEGGGPKIKLFATKGLRTKTKIRESNYINTRNKRTGEKGKGREYAECFFKKRRLPRTGRDMKWGGGTTNLRGNFLTKFSRSGGIRSGRSGRACLKIFHFLSSLDTR